MMALRLWKRGWYVTTRDTTVSFLSGLSNNSSKLFSETLLIWASRTFWGYPLLQNQVFKFLSCFWKANGDEQSLLIRNSWVRHICTNNKRVSLGMFAAWLIRTKFQKRIQKILIERQKERSNGKAWVTKSDWLFQKC